MSCVSLSLVLALVCAAVVHSTSKVKYIDHSRVHGPKYLTAEDFANAKSIKHDSNAKIDDSAMYNPNLYQGDIVPSGRLLNAMGLSLKDPRARHYYHVMRNAIREHYGRKWHDGKVPYELSSSYTSEGRALIAEAMDTYANKTCVRFVPRESGDKDYLSIQPLDGCYSLLGRNGSEQELSLGEGCMVRGIIEHELMHSIGFDHEQNRSDRDLYVTIEWENIYSGFEDQFEIRSDADFDNFGRPYDYGSVMHYGPTGFSKNGKPTIVPKKQGVEIGQRKGLSQSDIEEVNIYYKCDKPVTSETAKPETTEPKSTEPTEIPSSNQTTPESPATPGEPKCCVLCEVLERLDQCHLDVFRVCGKLCDNCVQ